MTRDEMIAALEAKDQAPQTTPGNPSRADMIAALETSDQAPAHPPSSWKDTALKGAYYATRPFDYAGGLARTSLATMGQAEANFAGKLKSMATGDDFTPTDIVKPQDMVAALKGNAPPLAEYLKRGGIPEGGKLSELLPMLYSNDPRSWRPRPGGALDPTARGTVGMLGDAATDPLTYAGLPGVRGALKAAGETGVLADKALHPVETALAASGKSAYKTAPTMKAVDAVADQFNKGSVSDELFAQGVTGTGRDIAQQAQVLADNIGRQRNKLLQNATDKGALLEMDRAMAPAQEIVDKIKASRDPNLQGLGNQLQGQINEYTKLNPRPEISYPKGVKAEWQDASGRPLSDESIMEGLMNAQKQALLDPSNLPHVNGGAYVWDTIPGSPGVTPVQGSGFKSSLYNDTGNAAWDTLRKTPQGDKGTKALARGLDAETSAASERVIPGSGSDINELNDRWGKLLTTAKTFEKEARKGENKNVLTSVDGMILPFIHNNPALLATKKAADLSKTNWLHTKGGMAMYELSQNLANTPGGEEILRRILTDQSYQDPNQDPWLKLRKGN